MSYLELWAIKPQQPPTSQKSVLLFYLIIVSYSLSFPLESFHFLYMTDASTLAGENVFGSFNREIILSNIVLKLKKIYGKCPKISNTLIYTFLGPKLCFLYLVEWQQFRLWSDCSSRSSLIWVYTVCICHFVRNFGVRKFRIFIVQVYMYGYSSR